MTYKPTIGLEIHIWLKTKKTMFCASLNDSNEKGRMLIFVRSVWAVKDSAGYKSSGEKSFDVRKSVKRQARDYSRFDRKYFLYPDLPKGYQINQYKFPLIGSGELNEVKITRIHLEEGVGRGIHAKRRASNECGLQPPACHCWN